MSFTLKTPFQPTGNQPQAIKKLTKGVEAGNKHQTLLGVTGSGKTFTMANIIANTQRPTLVVAHNKTLAAQLYQEFRDFFPANAVSYFVSYYDYYQPEAYIPTTDTYIEKEADINDEIDKLRLAATTNLLTRPDTIVVASVSCIYNLGSPVEYGQYLLELKEGEIIPRKSLLLQLTNLQYEHSTTDFRRGTYRPRGDTIQIWPAYQNTALKVETLENKITKIQEIDPISGNVVIPTSQDPETQRFIIYPAKHYMMNQEAQTAGMKEIEKELEFRLKEMEKMGKTLEAYRLKQKVNYDLEMMREFGFVNGIENYSRYFDGRNPGQPPYTLLDYFAESQKRFGLDSFLTIIDESHMTLPQIRGMYHGDRSRKETLIEYGFRLPSALDNRPLQFHEFLERTPQNIYVSATPDEWEQQQSGQHIAEQLIRPNGLVDPLIELRPIQDQIEELVIEVIRRKSVGQRVLVTTLTKKMAEALTEYLNTPEKIDKLIASFQQKQTVEKYPETTYQRDEYINTQNMEIGKINTAFFSRIEPLKNTKQIPKPKVAYLHSDIETLDRSDILDDLRKGEYDVLVGINLLREGLDLPEVSLVAILDADKEGFLRSTTSLIQTMGRAARHEDGRVILFADNLTKSMKQAIEETQRRREYQVDYNAKHGITPQTIQKPIREKLLLREETHADKQHKKGRLETLKGTTIRLSKKEVINLESIDPEAMTPAEKNKLARKLNRRMKQAANDLDYELAALLRDTIHKLM
ncbi:MAG: excinuclease ABC subunit B [Candidatus Pacebacteria bacterium GW2011_GWB1_47_8]|nr:MAG: excinuclease ABC subunit B [Candidatus Pacebacteria bacterium GW2011_GWA1_46_10]KKU84569.1 MAG: excinuclease ABC subunit B [Candidatus Pacebacteria bacterium GW2011_GWB1_47_8]HCR81649.1 excinuclease ABC subunit B [Candidatus Paceibacterota bacterium]